MSPTLVRQHQQPSAYWEEAPNVLAGRDLKGSGSWLGVTRSGKIAAVTNFRGSDKVWENAPSRGNLVSSFLMSGEPPDTFVDRLHSQARD
jgi:uncharacterized protein with NRDE domain